VKKRFVRLRRLVAANLVRVEWNFAALTLTGEAMPLEKVPTAQAGTAETPFDLHNICFMGSAVVSGIGCGVVVLTGPRTAFGQVASAIGEQRVLTSFDKGITRFTWLMLTFIVVMAPLVFVINGFTKGNWLEALLFAVAVAVGLTPEMLPMILTVNLAKGAMAMSRRKVIVKRLNAIQNFGAIDVLCTDKTGTLTQDRIILKRHVNIRGDDSDRVLEYSATPRSRPNPGRCIRRRVARASYAICSL
jgi:P-type Mg2+ transporter